VSRRDHIGLGKEDRCETRDTRKRGELANWTPAYISYPLEWVSGAIKTADMHAEGGGLREVMV